MAGCKIAPGRNLREDGMASSLASSLGAVGSTAPDRVMTIRAGLIGGVIGGVIIWIYEAIVWVGVQHLLPLAGIPRNATGLVFGKAVQEQLGGFAYLARRHHGRHQRPSELLRSECRNRRLHVASVLRRAAGAVCEAEADGVSGVACSADQRSVIRRRANGGLR